ncbi:MAG: hypothetical protein MAG431_00460 [Chloroflexi bacterium]|nr:hypothetical protein [Chloroflexota bacterium]
MSKKITFEHLYYFVIFSLALFVRTLMLGSAPLGAFEAGWAYQAWELARGLTSQVGFRTSYLILTEGTFSLLGSTNALARFWPALAGSLLVWVPFLFRYQLGPKAALIMALGLALDPGLVAVSRLAGGPILAVSFLFLAGGMFWHRKALWAVFLGGMALLSGPATWMGLWGMVVTLGMLRLLAVRWEARSLLGRLSAPVTGQPGRERFSPWGLALPLGMLILLATFFLQHYQGLSAWMSALPAFVGGWWAPSLVPAGRLAAALVVYQPLALVFGLVGGVRGFVRGEKSSQVLLVWFGVTLGLALLYPGRQVYDLAWSLIPLWGLAGMELARSLSAVKAFWVTRTQAAFVFVLCALAWLSFTTLVSAGGSEMGAALQWGIIGATILLAALTTAIVAGEWSWLVARKGVVSGISFALGFYALAAMVGVAYLRPGDPRELWYPGAGGGQAALLQESLGDVGLLESGRQENLEIVVQDGAAVLPWVLRGYAEVHFRESAIMDARPPVIITEEDEASQPWTAAYRGQDFVLKTSPAWDGALPVHWKTWLAFREAPLVKEKSVLWVRWDLFPFVTEEDESAEDEPPLEENLEENLIEPLEEK